MRKHKLLNVCNFAILICKIIEHFFDVIAERSCITRGENQRAYQEHQSFARGREECRGEDEGEQ
jgi:hypothetical protein